MNKHQIALQMYSVRELAQPDMLGTLRRVGAIGYPAVEFAGYGGVPATEIRALLDSLGMQTAGAHVPLADLQTKPDQVFADLHTLGCTYAVVPWVGEEYRGGEAAVQQLAGILNDLGARCRAAGLQLVYHNHNFEFAGTPGPTMWDRLTAATDPDLVALELDVYWAAFAGADPLALIDRYSARLALLHLKDMTADATRAYAPVGTGTLPWAEILAAGTAAGVRWFVVEQDKSADPLADAALSLRNLGQLAAPGDGTPVG
jgi:sugar phosphate isomerase/epimerase